MLSHQFSHWFERSKPYAHHPMAVQTITITGQRFVGGLTILLDAPTGLWTTYSGDAITVQSETQFTARVMLDKTGVWDVTVHNPDGSESNEVQFTVVASGQ